jgi:hypothetical protein
MASRFIAAFAFGLAAVTACDVSQKTPQTAAHTAGLNPVAPAGTVAVGRESLSPSDTPLRDGVGTAVGERSIRLYGRGVNRKRQTRI